MRASARGGVAGSRRGRRAAWDLLVYGLLLAGLLLVLLPFAWMLSTSLKSLSEVFTTRLRLLPARPEWGNYAKVWRQLPFGRFYLNSLVVSALATGAQLFLGSLAAFAFARLRWPGRDRLFVLYLAAMMIPSQVTLIPNFLLVRALGGIDTYWGIVLPQAFSVFGVFLLRQFFRGIPRSLEEAAIIDGAGNWRVYASVVMPLAKPGLAALGVFAFMFSWNNFLWPLVVSYKESMFTLPIGLLSFQGQYATDFPLMMAAACQAMLPVLALYAVAQKSFIEGVALTGLANA
jgi:multiple sugar transport system permease protein